VADDAAEEAEGAAPGTGIDASMMTLEEEDEEDAFTSAKLASSEECWSLLLSLDSEVVSLLRLYTASARDDDDDTLSRDECGASKKVLR